MYKYSSFVEYIQLNYIENITKALEDFIVENEMVLYTEKPSAMHHYDSFEVKSIKVYGVRYTKNKRDNLEFDVLLKATFSVLDDVFDPDSGFPPFFEKTESYRYGMKGSFKKGFTEKDDLERIEEEPERLTDTLVPIISLEEMDDYAAKFLKEFCPEALTTPMRLNLSEMLSKKGIVIRYAPLPDNIFGKTYFAKDKATVFKEFENGEFFVFGDPLTEEIEVDSGTILINFDKAMELPNGAYRNTIVHEAVHWFFHSNYFELRLLLNNELTCVSCCKGERDYENDEIAWMEWQARAMAPRILMPKKMAILKWKEILEEYKEEAKEKEYTRSQIYEKSLKKFSKFFDVSETSARIRLKELGMSEVEGINNYVDGKHIKSFFYKKGALDRNQTFMISQDELRILLRSNLFLQNALLQEKVFYVNNMIVVNNPDYFDCKKHELTEYALNHVDECCLIFNIERFGITSTGEVTKNYLLSTINNRRESKDVMMEHASKVLPSTNESYCHFQQHKRELPNTFGETLEYHYKYAKKKHQYNSYEDLAYDCDVSDRSLRKYKDGEVIPKRQEVLKICLALKLSVPYIMDMLDKADCGLTFNNADNNILLTTLIAYPRVGLVETYRILEQDGMGYLLGLSENWLADNDLA